MNIDFNRLARWSIPGWISIFAFLLFTFTDYAISASQSNLVNNYSLGNLDFAAIFSALNGSSAILIAFAGAPLGFLIYEIYFFVENILLPSTRSDIPLIVGRMEELKVSLSNKDLTLSDSWREQWLKRPTLYNNTESSSRYAILFFKEAAQEIDGKSGGVHSVTTDYHFLTDLILTIGTSLTGIFLGFTGYLFLKTYMEQSRFLIYFGSVILFLILMMAFLEKDRRLSTNISFDYQRWLPFIVHPNYIFLALLGLVYFFGNPNLTISSSATWDTVIKITISAILILVFYGNTARNYRWKVALREFAVIVLFLITTISAKSLLPKFFLSLDWSFFTTLFIFLIINLILSKNRQYANDELLSLVSYTIKRYNTESKSKKKVAK